MGHPLLRFLRIFRLKLCYLLLAQLLLLAFGASPDFADRNTSRNEIAPHGVRAPLAQFQVVLLRAAKVGVPNDPETRVVVVVLFVFLEAVCSL